MVQIRLDNDDAYTIKDWQHFLETALQAGASVDTAVERENHYQDDSILIGFKINVDSDDQRRSPKTATIPAEMLYDLLNVVRAMASSDGDVRGLLPQARTMVAALTDYLLLPVIGHNPWEQDTPTYET